MIISLKKTGGIYIMTVGEEIKQLRNENGLSQEKLAEKLNVSRSAVAKWETDGRLS